MLFHLFQPVAQFIDVQVCHFGDILIPDSESQGFRLESETVTFRAFNDRDKLVSPFLAVITFVILHHLPEIVDDAIVGTEIVGGSMHLLLIYLYVFQGSIENFLHGNIRNSADRSLEIEVVF